MWLHVHERLIKESETVDELQTRLRTALADIPDNIKFLREHDPRGNGFPVRERNDIPTFLQDGFEVRPTVELQDTEEYTAFWTDKLSKAAEARARFLTTHSEPLSREEFGKLFPMGDAGEEWEYPMIGVENPEHESKQHNYEIMQNLEDDLDAWAAAGGE